MLTHSRPLLTSFANDRLVIFAHTGPLAARRTDIIYVEMLLHAGDMPHIITNVIFRTHGHTFDHTVVLVRGQSDLVTEVFSSQVRGSMVLS